MSNETYETPELTVLGDVAELTGGKSGGFSDQAGLDGGGSFTPPN